MFINNIPVVSGRGFKKKKIILLKIILINSYIIKAYGDYLNIIYFYMNKKTKKLEVNKTLIEGPVPMINKFFYHNRITTMKLLLEEDL